MVWRDAGSGPGMTGGITASQPAHRAAGGDSGGKTIPQFHPRKSKYNFGFSGIMVSFAV